MATPKIMIKLELSTSRSDPLELRLPDDETKGQAALISARGGIAKRENECEHGHCWPPRPWIFVKPKVASSYATVPSAHA